MVLISNGSPLARPAELASAMLVGEASATLGAVDSATCERATASLEGVSLVGIDIASGEDATVDEATDELSVVTADEISEDEAMLLDETSSAMTELDEDSVTAAADGLDAAMADDSATGVTVEPSASGDSWRTDDAAAEAAVATVNSVDIGTAGAVIAE